MASNQTRWVKNLLGPHITGPAKVPGNFAVGTTAALKRGELIELTGNGSTEWVPMDSDFAMAGNAAIMGQELKAADPAGLYEIICPRVGDIFEYELLSTDAQNPAIGSGVYFSTSEIVTTTAGTSKIGHIVGWGHLPYPQNSNEGGGFDKGTTRQSVPGGRVWISFTEAASYFVALFPTAV